MDSIFVTQEHQLLRDQIARFITEEVLPNGDEWEGQGQIPRGVLRKLGEMGVLGLRVPVKYGGSELDTLAAVVLAEALAQCTYGGFTATVAVHTDMASPHLINSGTEAQKQRYLPGVVTGEIITAIAVTEPNSGSDVQGLRTRAVRDSGGWRINGRKVYITNGVLADLILVAARTDLNSKPSRGISMFLVERATPGFTVSRQLEKVGWHASDTGELVFDDVLLPEDSLLGDENKGFYAIMENFQNERLIAAAMHIGEAKKAIELTLEYVKTRSAFSAPLWSKQVIRQRLALLSSQVEALRHLVYHTAWLDTQRIDCVKEVSMAKAWGSELLNQVMYNCQQFHGAFGLMHGTPIERMARDARIHAIAGGATEVLLDEVARRL